MAALGVLSALPVTSARACDNDRYPCPIVSQTQDNGRRGGSLAHAVAQENEPRRTAGRETAREDRRRSIAH